MWISFGRETATDIWTGVEHRNYGVQTKSKLNDLGRADGKTPQDYGGAGFNPTCSQFF